MLKKALPVLLLALVMAGCSTPFTPTNLTARQQQRNANNLYPMEVALYTRQKTLEWGTIQPYVKVGQELYPMRLTSLMTNRWEALVPIPATTKEITYRYKFEFKYNVFGGPPKPDSRISPEYTLRIFEQ
jgi:heat shock protein HslJ